MDLIAEARNIGYKEGIAKLSLEVLKYMQDNNKTTITSVEFKQIYENLKKHKYE